MVSASLTPVDWLNLWGVGAQIFGFAILARDLWPEYRKAKRAQMIMYFHNFTRYAVDRLDKGDRKAVYWAYAASKDGLMIAKDELLRHWVGEYPSKKADDIIENEDVLREINAGLELYSSEWIEKIQSNKTYRNMYVGEAIFIVIAGYGLQLAAILTGAKIWPFSLLLPVAT